MLPVQSKETMFLRVAQEVANYTYLWLMDEMFNPHDFELMQAISDAQKKGLSQAEIMIAITVGQGWVSERDYLNR